MHSAISSDLHRDMIGSLPHRPWQIDGTPLDHTWYIRTTKEGERAPSVKINFDVPIRSWPNASRLTAPEHLSDLITVKMITWLSLEPSPLGWIQTASTVPGFVRNSLNFIRWKIHMGVRRNSEFNAAHHRLFIAKYREGGLGSLLNLREKATALIEAERNGELQLPPGYRGCFFHSGIETLLGLTINQTPPEAIEVLLEYATSKKLRFQRDPRKLVGIQPRNTRKTTAHAQLSIWQTLFNYSDYLQHDPLIYDAYSDEGELQNSLKGWAADETPTPDAPAYQTSWLIDAAVRFIFDEVVEDILNFGETAMSHASSLKAYVVFQRIIERLNGLGFGEIADVYRRHRYNNTGDRITFRELLFKQLSLSCVIVISAFGARRNSENKALRPGCVQEDEHGELWLHCWIAKNKRVLTKIPTNRVVRHAVRILERIAKLSQRYGDPEWLLESYDSGGAIEHKTNEALKTFAKWVSVPPLPDGTFWEFKSHQFRKFFATTYQWRYFYPEFGVLNHHMRQSIPVTAAYVKMQGAASLRQYDQTNADRKAREWIERDRRNSLREEECAFITQLLLAVLQGQEKLGGVKGRELTAQLELRFSQQIIITASGDGCTQLNLAVRELAKDLHMTVHPEGHSICGCGHSVKEKETAACLKLKAIAKGDRPGAQDGPDYAYADDDVCNTCPHNIRLGRLLPYWDSSFRNAHEATFSENADVAEAGRQRAKFIQDGVYSELR